jgi:hypothetical protein
MGRIMTDMYCYVPIDKDGNIDPEWHRNWLERFIIPEFYHHKDLKVQKCVQRQLIKILKEAKKLKKEKGWL